MKRREFVIGLGAASAYTALAYGADKPRIGFLNNGSSSSYGSLLEAFRSGLREAGFVEGLNVDIEYRWGNGENNKLPSLISDLSRTAPTIILASGGTATALAAKEANLSIPIVFVLGGDPVKFGLVHSLNQPGVSITGVSFLANSLISKQLEVAHELISKEAKIGFLVNPSNPNAQSDRHEVTEAARKLGHEVVVEIASGPPDVGSASSKLVRAHVAVILIAPDALFTSERETIILIAHESKIPTVYNSREFVEAGGLIGYGAKQSEAYKIAGNYAGRVLLGQKPAELPVVQSSIIELVINLKTAKLLGLSIPQSLLVRADEVIE